MTVTEAVALGGVILSAGAALAQLATVRERMQKVERSIENLGTRIGTLEQKAAVAESELSRPYRSGPK